MPWEIKQIKHILGKRVEKFLPKFIKKKQET